ncbi:hypothetical protein [Rhizobium rhizoryzae]|uniref:Uncharacterized protein n=1 Tax=Rhizobium rhizoryzae TaxID=451876 RepID=A0A7W6LKG5_9HYPH|nr:hypothetical protein [Rhizobium rhizoryzae]MBB4146049.1 hypothetical protein [Rhizobium rhizoryzae]
MRINKKDRTKTVREMADYMRKHSANCTREILMLQFTNEEIDLYSEEARTVANREADEPLADAA